VNVLVVNCGSSSIKYSLYAIEGGADAAVLASGLIERIGEDAGGLRHTASGREIRRAAAAPDHEAAFALMVEALTAGDGAVVAGPEAIDAVGHRVVHGGERFAESTVIDDEVIGAIEAFAALAPLHNPPNLTGIRAARRLMPGVPHVAVFDTAFHQTLEPHAYLYAIPYGLYAEHGVRRYGFHGTSHRYVSQAAAVLLARPADEVNLITLHLGNGCSAAAVRGGTCIDTSLGLTPLEGLVMGTRSGDIDPAVVFHLVRALGMTVDDVDDLLNRRSGLLGVSGVSNDMREVTRAADEGNERAALAIRLFCHRLRKYIGAYTAELGRVDALVFTGGIGENAAGIRRQACEGLEPLGYVLDAAANAAAADGPRDVAAAASAARLLVIPTDEEALIARDTARLAAGAGG
jgi:acetate kinase